MKWLIKLNKNRKLKKLLELRKYFLSVTSQFTFVFVPNDKTFCEFSFRIIDLFFENVVVVGTSINNN